MLSINKFRCLLTVNVIFICLYLTSTCLCELDFQFNDEERATLADSHNPQEQQQQQQQQQQQHNQHRYHRVTNHNYNNHNSHHQHQQQQHKNTYSKEIAQCPYTDNKLMLSLILKSNDWSDFIDTKKFHVINKISKFFNVPKEFIKLDSISRPDMIEMTKWSIKRGPNKCNSNGKHGKIEFMIGCDLSSYFTIGRSILKQIGQQMKDGAIDDITGVDFGWWIIWKKRVTNRISRKTRQISEGSGLEEDEEDYNYDDDEEYNFSEPITEVPTTPTHAHRHHHGVMPYKPDYKDSKIEKISIDTKTVIDAKNNIKRKKNDFQPLQKQQQQQQQKSSTSVVMSTNPAKIATTTVTATAGTTVQPLDEEIFKSVSQLESVITKTIENTEKIKDLSSIIEMPSDKSKKKLNNKKTNGGRTSPIYKINLDRSREDDLIVDDMITNAPTTTTERQSELTTTNAFKSELIDTTTTTTLKQSKIMTTIIDTMTTTPKPSSTSGDFIPNQLLNNQRYNYNSSTNNVILTNLPSLRSSQPSSSSSLSSSYFITPTTTTTTTTTTIPITTIYVTTTTTETPSSPYQKLDTNLDQSTQISTVITTAAKNDNNDATTVESLTDDNSLVVTTNKVQSSSMSQQQPTTTTTSAPIATSTILSQTTTIVPTTSSFLSSLSSSSSSQISTTITAETINSDDNTMLLNSSNHTTAISLTNTTSNPSSSYDIINPSSFTTTTTTSTPMVEYNTAETVTSTATKFISTFSDTTISSVKDDNDDNTSETDGIETTSSRIDEASNEPRSVIQEVTTMRPITTTSPPTTDYIEPEPINEPPTIRSRLPKQPVTAGKPFSFIVPLDTFHDNEDETNLRLELFDSNGHELKSTSWLQFNPEKREIYGLPLEDAVSKWQYKLTATDSGNATVSDILDISVQQHKGHRSFNHEISLGVKLNQKFLKNIDWQLRLVKGIADTLKDDSMSSIVVREIRQNQQDPNYVTFVFTNESLPKDQCPEEKLDELVARLDREILNAAVMPELSIKSIMGQPIGACKKVNVIKTSKPTPSMTKNRAPMPRNQVDRVNATVGQLLVFKVPQDTFYDPEDFTDLKMSLLNSNNTALNPKNWLQFDSKNQEFYGIPFQSDVGSSEYLLVAEDREGLKANDALVVVVNQAPRREFSVYFKAALSMRLESFNANMQRKFVERIALLFGDLTTDNIQIRSISDNYYADGIIVQFYNTTLYRNHRNHCPEDEIEMVRNVWFSQETTLRDRVKKAIGSEFGLTTVQMYPPAPCNIVSGDIHQSRIPITKTIDDNGDASSSSSKDDDYLLTFVLPAVIILAMILLALIIACVLHRRRLTGKMELGDEEERKSFRSKGIPVIFQDELDEKPEIGNKSPIILKDEKPPLLPPSYNNSTNIDGDNDCDEYVPPPAVVIGGREVRGKSPVTPSYRKPPPYVSP